MGSLVQQAQRAYATWKAANSPADVSEWAALSDAEALALWRSEQLYLAAISDAQAIEDAFYAARAAARAALQASWQSKEEAGYDVDA